MAVNRKGVFYTITSIILVFVMIFAFNVFEVNRSLDKNAVVLARVKATNNLVQNIDRDLARAVQISSLRATLALEERIVDSGSFLSDASSAYEEAIMNGTVNSVQSSLMLDSTFPDWVAKIQSEASKTGVVVSFVVHDIEVYQDDPWSVKGRINLSMNVTDIKGTSSWYQEKELIGVMSIVGLEDPLYAVKTYGRVPNVINQTPYDGSYTFGADVSNLKDHVENSYYANSTSAPSFLMRFEGDLGSSPYGIESFVNLGDLQDQGLSIQSKTTMDYLYWGSTATTDYHVTGMPSWYMIDNGHTAKYGVTGLTY